MSSIMTISVSRKIPLSTSGSIVSMNRRAVAQIRNMLRTSLLNKSVEDYLSPDHLLQAGRVVNLGVEQPDSKERKRF